MKVLITGANGQLGLELQGQLRELNKEVQVIATDYDTLNITSLSEIKTRFSILQPDVVINCAAHTAGDKGEDESEKAYKMMAYAVPEELLK